MPIRLPAGFFERDRVVVAKSMIGKVLIHRYNHREIKGVITETEAYGGDEDPAAHTFVGKTKRNWPLFGDAGLVYVYLIYGMHLCFNVSVGRAGEPGGVLVRGIALLPNYEVVLGPGRVGKVMHFTREDNGIQATDSDANIWFEDWGFEPEKLSITPRIGIKKATEKLWRFLGTFHFSTSTL